MNSNSTKREIRKFGALALFFFGALCAVAIWRQRVVPSCLFGTLSFLGAGFLLMPGPFRPIHEAWQKLAHFIGIVFTQAILVLAWYLVMTPAAWIKRLLGGRPLPMKPDPSAESYWVSRREPSQPRDRFYLRY
jgi:hypothetical protein